jgi:hypothetical protein
MNANSLLTIFGKALIVLFACFVLYAVYRGNEVSFYNWTTALVIVFIVFFVIVPVVTDGYEILESILGIILGSSFAGLVLLPVHESFSLFSITFLKEPMVFGSHVISNSLLLYGIVISAFGFILYYVTHLISDLWDVKIIKIWTLISILAAIITLIIGAIIIVEPKAFLEAKDGVYIFSAIGKYNAYFEKVDGVELKLFLALLFSSFGLHNKILKKLESQKKEDEKII